MDCGTDGQILALVSTASRPNGIHEKSFRSIADRWSTIWPDFRRNITDLMRDYNQEPADWGSVRTLCLELPDEPLVEDAEWSIGVVFSEAGTMWVLPYRGLLSLPDKAQAIW
jgi:hypothetical protein